ncbi:Hypothetical protein BN2458_PEG1052 [Helicobacter typhlonius]|uniref:Uncharacterized protein n=1 Tax=Helicobacter typhlonius TaxID=76936 RepID=A0A0S4PV65_9HELI|nr:Hypothetical protein BN2458_PEG1052 [Helicobacter typhlonius]
MPISQTLLNYFFGLCFIFSTPYLVKRIIAIKSFITLNLNTK